MQYLQPFLYFVRKPKTGYKNVLLGCLCPLIPVAGEMVLLGYRAEISEELERDPDLKDHPDFDLDRLMPYLQRGVWPFLARLVFTLVTLPIFGVLAVLAGFAAFGLAGEEILAFGVGYAVFFALYILAATFLWPMEYHAQVTRKFALLEELKFAIRFARVCWFTTFVSVLMFTMFSSVVMFLGLLLCYIGMYPAAVIVNMAEQHMLTQLYKHYLEEGGEPLVRPEAIEERGRYDEEYDDEDEPPQRARRVD